jgi:hypothetical protein
MVEREQAETLEVQDAALPAADTPSPAPVVASSEPAKTPDPSTETAEPKSALEAALRAMGMADEGKAAAALPAEPAKTETDQTAQQDDDQGDVPGVPMLAPDVFRALPKEARTVLKDLRKQVTTLRPDAERGQAVANYMKEAGVTPAEFVELQDVGAMMKRDPAKAREVLLKHLDRLDEHLGLKLPADLQEEVETGAMTSEHAATHARTRAERDAAAAALAQRDAEQAQSAMLRAAEGWETDMRQRDPDFGRKLPLIQRETRLLIQERMQAGRPPRTAEDTVEIVKGAYARVEEDLKPFRQMPSVTPRSPSSAAASVPSAAVVAPKTALEAAMAGLNAMRAG